MSLLHSRNAREDLTHIRFKQNKFYISEYSFARYPRMNNQKILCSKINRIVYLERKVSYFWKIIIPFDWKLQNIHV